MATDPAKQLKIARKIARDLKGDDVTAMIVRALKTGCDKKGQPLTETELEWLLNFVLINMALGQELLWGELRCEGEVDNLNEVRFRLAVPPQPLSDAQVIELPQRRLHRALEDAAIELHPGWRRIDDRTIEKLDDSAPEPNELIEWLYKNYPERARAVKERA